MLVKLGCADADRNSEFYDLGPGATECNNIHISEHEHIKIFNKCIFGYKEMEN